MPDISNQQSDLFVVEPVERLDGSPVPQKERLRAGWRRQLGLPGILALAEGLALLICFFCFPWFYFPDVTIDRGPGNTTPPFVDYSGWGASLGLPIGDGQHLILFVHLWLVPLAAVALLALALIYALRRFPARLTLSAVIALSVLALLVEGGFYLQVFSLKPVLFSGPGGGDWIGIVWGFWAAVAVNVAAIAGSVYLLRAARSRSAAAGAAEGAAGETGGSRG